MPARGQWRRDVGKALAGGVWALACLVSAEPAAAVVLPAALMVALASVRRHPVVGGVGVAAVMAAGHVAFGVPADNPWNLAAALIGTYTVGRHGTGRAAVPVIAAFWAVFVWDDPTLPTALFAAVLAGAPWALGAALRQRVRQAVRATERAAALARVDATARAQQVVAEERARLAADVLAMIRGAVRRMRAHAEAAQDDLEPGALAAIQDEGRRATAELRTMLGLLRSEHPSSGAVDAAGSGRPARPRQRIDVLLGVALACVFALETVGAALGWRPLAVASSLWLITAVVLRRTHPTVACLLATATPALGLLLDVRLGYGLWSGVAAALLIVAATAGRDRAAWLAAGSLATVLLLDVVRHDPDNVGITLATLVLAGIVGRGWGTSTRAQHVAEATSATLSAQHAAVAEQALRADRLQLARELHDVTSHAVGVMVLQAGAAAALRERDPPRARDAVRIITTTATEALTQVDELFDLLDAGTVGAAGLAAVAPAADLVEALVALAERVRHAGLRVLLDVADARVDDPVIIATAYRIVQESLTNAMRHAPGSAVSVRVRHDDDRLEVCVRDDGASGSAPSGGRGGFGLLGLGERVAALGGEIRTGPRADHGFEVRAALPLDGRVRTPR